MRNLAPMTLYPVSDLPPGWFDGFGTGCVFRGCREKATHYRERTDASIPATPFHGVRAGHACITILCNAHARHAKAGTLGDATMGRKVGQNATLS